MHTCILVADEGDIYELLHKYSAFDEESSGTEALFDYFGVGGRFSEVMKLKEPRKLRKFFGLIPAGETSFASVAKKAEIVEDSIWDGGAPSLFLNGTLFESPYLGEDEHRFNLWNQKFIELWKTIPEDRTLQIVDAHS